LQIEQTLQGSIARYGRIDQLEPLPGVPLVQDLNQLFPESIFPPLQAQTDGSRIPQQENPAGILRFGYGDLRAEQPVVIGLQEGPANIRFELPQQQRIALVHSLETGEELVLPEPVSVNQLFLAGSGSYRMKTELQNPQAPLQQQEGKYHEKHFHQKVFDLETGFQ
jgi:hypothetical protein